MDNQRGGITSKNSLGNFTFGEVGVRSLKVVFAGTPEFAAEILSMIIQAKYEVVLVMTQPDRPGGRGLKLQQSPLLRTNKLLESPRTSKLKEFLRIRRSEHQFNLKSFLL